VRHVVEVQQIAPEGGDEFLRATMFESDLVVDAGVVDERIDVAELRNSLIDRVFAAFVFESASFADRCTYSFGAARLSVQLCL